MQEMHQRRMSNAPLVFRVIREEPIAPFSAVGAVRRIPLRLSLFGLLRSGAKTVCSRLGKNHRNCVRPDANIPAATRRARRPNILNWAIFVYDFFLLARISTRTTRIIKTVMATVARGKNAIASRSRQSQPTAWTEQMAIANTKGGQAEELGIIIQGWIGRIEASRPPQSDLPILQWNLALDLRSMPVGRG